MEFTPIIDETFSTSDEVIISGDFNMHWDKQKQRPDIYGTTALIYHGSGRERLNTHTWLNN